MKQIVVYYAFEKVFGLRERTVKVRVGRVKPQDLRTKLLEMLEPFFRRDKAVLFELVGKLCRNKGEENVFLSRLFFSDKKGLLRLSVRDSLEASAFRVDTLTQEND